MNSKILAKLSSPLSLLLLAAVLAGGVAWVAYFYLQQREEAMKTELAAKGRKKETPKVGVVVPKADAGVNTVLNTNNFVSRQIEADLVYPDAVLAKDFASMEGQKLARPLMRGRPLRLTDLQLPVVVDVSTILPAGSRAMTIDIDNLNSIAQTLRPNHHVDIFLLSKAQKSGNTATDADEKMLEQASLFMQDMVVLATGKEFLDVSAPPEQTSKMVRPGDVEGARESGYGSITLLVTPAQAAKLLVGQKMGSYRVVLRGTTDRDAVKLPPLRVADLTPAATKARDAGIEFIVGGRGSDMVSKLAIPPSQMSAGPMATGPLSTALASKSVRAESTTDQAVGAGAPFPSSEANQPIPALRATK